MAFLGELLTNVADRGRALIGFERFMAQRNRPIDRLCEDLLSGRGEASGMALAQGVLDAWERLDKPGGAPSSPCCRNASGRITSGSTGLSKPTGKRPERARSRRCMSPPSRAARSCCGG